MLAILIFLVVIVVPIVWLIVRRDKKWEEGMRRAGCTCHLGRICWELNDNCRIHKNWAEWM